MKTLTELKRVKKWNCTRKFIGQFAKEDYSTWVKYIESEVEKKFGIEALKEIEVSSKNQDNLSFGNYIFFAPKVLREVKGIVEFRSNDYVFHYTDNFEQKTCYGVQVKKEMLTDFGFVFNEIEYHIEGF